MFRRFISITLAFLFFASAGGLLPVRAQEKNYTAEQVVESLIYIYGTRPNLAQIRRNGIERGRMTLVAPDGKLEESSYERRFIRGESQAKDKVRLDQKLPTMEYSLIYGEGKTWGIINGSAFTPRQEASQSFLSQIWHGIDALLRYKENGSTIALAGKDKQKNIDLYMIDLTDKEQHKTRYYVSVKSLHVLWLDYEESPNSTPVKYRRNFYDYRYAQGTLVPYRTVLMEDGKQIQETRVLTVTYGVKMEDALFQNPEAQANVAQP